MENDVSSVIPSPFGAAGPVYTPPRRSPRAVPAPASADEGHLDAVGVPLPALASRFEADLDA